MSATLQETLTEISPMLCKFAAHHTSSAYSPTVEGLAQEAQDLYQHAVTEILRTCKDGDTRSYILTKADWRMSNRCTSDRVYGMRISTESDMASIESEDDDDLETILDEIKDDDDNGGDPESILIQIEQNERFMEVYRHLKPEHASLVRLLSDGFSLPEVAAKIGISYESAWKRIVKIRETFQMAGLSPNSIMA